MCPLPREDWKLFGYNPEPERPWSFFSTPLADSFEIFESDLDVGYDVSHCTKGVVINMGLYGIDLWLQDQHAKHPGLVPAGLIQQFRAICKKHTKDSPYVPPLESGPGSHPNPWKPRCFVIRALLRNPVFWQEVYELLPKQADGLEVTFVTPRSRSVQQERPQFYLRELRRPALQLITTAPKCVKARDRHCRRLHELFSVLHLQEERLTVQCHYFLAHYQARSLRHGNLQVGSIIVHPVYPLRQ